MKIIGIAGGSGSGKSTVSVGLFKKYPNQYALLHLDDYFKKKEEAPTLDRFTNWDHPDALDFDKLLSDVKFLMEGKSVAIFTKSELYHPEYDHSIKNKKEHIVEPKPFLIIEGYLSLYDQRLRNLMDAKLYLDIPIEESTKRRSSNKFFLDNEYFEKVLVPMHKMYVEPTKEYAVCIGVKDKDQEEVFCEVENQLL